MEMKIVKIGIAGTMESSDIIVSVEPNGNDGIEIFLQSSVEKQFGNQIKKVIKDTLEDLHVEGVIVQATDKGALDCTIKARVQTAVFRASDGGTYDWQGGKK